MKKYIPVFGPQELFDGASEFVEVIRFNDYSRDFLWGDLNTIQLLTFEELKAIPIVAMRRIEEAPEPKRWTVADQKAGRLPEVGNHLLTEGNLAEFIGLSHAPNSWCFRRLDGEWGIQTANKDWFSPIETPEEKEQREEDEFISSLSGADIQDGTVKDFFAQGARAAYRKLKGGE